jgi:hypothetical protein
MVIWSVEVGIELVLVLNLNFETGIGRVLRCETGIGTVVVAYPFNRGIQ